MEKLVLGNKFKLLCLYLVQHMLHQIKAQQFYNDLGLLSTVLCPTENSRIQGLFKGFKWFSSTFQGRFNFQGLFQESLLNSSTIQACANPGSLKILCFSLVV